MASAARAVRWHGGGTDASGAGIGGDGGSGAAARAAPRGRARSRPGGLRAVRLAAALLVCAGLHLAPAGDARAQTTVLDATMTGGSGSAGFTVDAVDVQLWGYRADEFGSLSDTTFSSGSVDYTITMVGQGSRTVGATTLNAGVFLLIEPAVSQAFLNFSHSMRWTYRASDGARDATFAFSEATHTVVGSTSLFRWSERRPGGLTSPVRVRITTGTATGGDYGTAVPGAGEATMFNQVMEVGSDTFTWVSPAETLSGHSYRLSSRRLAEQVFPGPRFRDGFHDLEPGHRPQGGEYPRAGPGVLSRRTMISSRGVGGSSTSGAMRSRSPMRHTPSRMAQVTTKRRPHTGFGNPLSSVCLAGNRDPSPAGPATRGVGAGAPHAGPQPEPGVRARAGSAERGARRCAGDP